MKNRLDVFCAEKTGSRSKAQDLIKEGLVRVNGKIRTKPGFLIEETDTIEIGEHKTYVSRAAFKLKAGIDAFSVDLKDQVVLDIGASTGGFTQVCLEAGAKKVYALDVGHLQLDETLDKDPRVIKMEGRNARLVKADWFDDPIDFVCMDVSFISCKTILEPVFEKICPRHIAVLIKPQFECGPQFLNKKGVVKNPKIIFRIVKDIEDFVSVRYETIRLVESPIRGRSGNQETILYACERRSHD